MDVPIRARPRWLAGIDGSLDAVVMNAGGMGGKTPMELTPRGHLHVRAERSWPRCPPRDAAGRGPAWRSGGLRRKRGGQGIPKWVQAASFVSNSADELATVIDGSYFRGKPDVIWPMGRPS